jgi:hypothetical protein
MAIFFKKYWDDNKLDWPGLTRIKLLNLRSRSWDYDNPK